jgi:hypothetical protein
MVATTRLPDGLYGLPHGGYVATTAHADSAFDRARLRPRLRHEPDLPLGGLRLAR